AVEKLRTGLSLNFGIADVTLLFEGEQDHLVPCCSQTLIDSDLFVVAGRMIGHSFLHGGPLLPGISPAVVQVLMGGPIETAEFKLEDCPDLEQRHTIQLLQGNHNLSEEEKEEVTRLAVSWDLPGFSEHHQKWLFNRLLQHTVILQHIAWPVADSDDDESLHPEIVTLKLLFFGNIFRKLQKLMSFWTGWEVPTASTCSRTLMLPADILTMDEFSSTLQACANTASTGFGLV
ncbi:hypothetical protein IRJ41_016606, partial [Triplophysa rosa]